MRGRIAWIELDRSPERGHRLFSLPAGLQGAPEIVMGLRKLRLQPDGAFKMPDGRLHLVLTGHQNSERVVCGRKSRIGTERFFQLDPGVLQSALFEIKVAQVVVGL